MASELGMRIVQAVQPVYDIVLPPTPTVRAAGLADVAPAAGLDVAVVGTIAAIVAGVLTLIVHRRRQK
ncbi:MAG TPA: hypothetical protein VFH48_34375 [Chloroflexota bacterium]|jgi:hypothetical protein|nr:hypothetical protein [Chloroflexota bacterium]